MLGLLAALHFAISGGVGVAHDIAGVRLELRDDHFALSAAVGPFSVGQTGGLEQESAALGLRWFAGDGARFFLSANYLFIRAPSLSGPEGDPETTTYLDHISVATLTAGWRFKWESGFFVDAAAGGGLYFDHDTRGDSRLLLRAITIPDVSLAIGLEF
jgi:hypothetical protein